MLNVMTWLRSVVVVMAVGALAIGCGSSAGAEQTPLPESTCESADACMKECSEGTTANACERAGTKKCALYDGARCNDVAAVHETFAKLLGRTSPSMAARHKTSASDHYRKACSFGVRKACGGQPDTSKGSRVVVPPSGTLPRPPGLKNPFAKRAPSQPPSLSRVKIVPLRALERLRTAGSQSIEPPRLVKDEMRRNGDKQIITSVKVCIDKFGIVSGQMSLTPTKYMRYETKIRRKINGWRFRPYKENGARHAACTVYTFIYRSR